MPDGSMMAPPRTRLMLEGRILPSLLRLSAPNVGEAAARVGFIAADAAFVGWLGKDALAGVTLVFPLFLVCQLISAGGIGTGVAAAVAGSLGAGERESADRTAAQALWFALAAGLAIGAVMVPAGPALYRVLGARGPVLAAASTYSAVVFGGVVLVWLMNLLANAVRGTGAMAVSAGSIVAGEAVHLVLSPSLILGLGPFPRLGVAGAGVAVLASYGTGAAILLVYLCSARAGVGLRAGSLSLRVDALRRILRIGVPATATMILWQATTIAGTILTARFGPAALAGYGAAQRLELVQTPISFALGSAAIAMVAANLGAAQPERAGAVARMTALLCGLIGIDFALIAFLAPAWWMGLFTHDPAVAASGILYLRSVAATLALSGVAYGLAFAFMGAGRATVPALASALRLGVLAAAGLVAIHAGFGLPALFATIAAANVVFAVVLIGSRGLLSRPTSRRIALRQPGSVP
ncbi:MAG: MATE family efflux transporter [Acetobacteraceae bacterium]